MNLSIIVNTCSLGPRAQEVTGSTTPSPHAWRAYALRHFILPIYRAYGSEVIVVGEYEDGEGYTYIPSPSRFFSAVDALHQRQEAFEASTGELVAFVHDDHLLNFARASNVPWGDADVFVPPRFRRGVGRLNNGFEAGYVSGHAAIYTREILEAAPWGDVPKVHTWDIEHTKMLRAAGARIIQVPALEAWDVEMETGE